MSGQATFAWFVLMMFVADVARQQRVKCPTCRCKIWPGARCRCCADVDVYASIEEDR